ASISANGTEQEVKNITTASLTAAYEEMLAQDEIDIYVVGDVNTEEMINKLREYLPFADRQQLEDTSVRNATPTIVEPYTKEQHDMKQGKLHIGFNASVLFGDDDFPKMQVFNGIFGGYAH